MAVNGVERGAWGRRSWKNGKSNKGYLHEFGQEALEGDVKILAGPSGRSFGCLFFASLSQTTETVSVTIFLLSVQLWPLVNCTVGSWESHLLEGEPQNS